MRFIGILSCVIWQYVMKRNLHLQCLPNPSTVAYMWSFSYGTHLVHLITHPNCKIKGTTECYPYQVVLIPSKV